MFLNLDPVYWIMMGPVMILAIYAQIKVHTTFTNFSRVPTRRGLTGAQAAERVLKDAGIEDVEVKEVDGFLSDHYDPKARTLNLSPGVYRGNSVSAVGVAAHEAGHAMQHAHGYLAMKVRSFVVPAASIGSWVAIPLIFLGAILHTLGLIKLGIVFFTAVVIFQIVTLPVEFNASTRAKAALMNSGVVTTEEEAAGVRKVLSAAAMTYVAATMAAVMQLLYLVLSLSGSRDE